MGGRNVAVIWPASHPAETAGVNHSAVCDGCLDSTIELGFDLFAISITASVTDFQTS